MPHLQGCISESLLYILFFPDHSETYLEKTVRPPVVAWVKVVVDAPNVHVDHVAEAVAAELNGVEGRLEVELQVTLLDEGRPHRLEVAVRHVLDDLHIIGIGHGAWGTGNRHRDLGKLSEQGTRSKEQGQRTEGTGNIGHREKGILREREICFKLVGNHLARLVDAPVVLLWGRPHEGGDS